MDQNEPSKGTEMNRNVPTRVQLTKISQNGVKWFKVYQNSVNTVTQNALK